MRSYSAIKFSKIIVRFLIVIYIINYLRFYVGLRCYKLRNDHTMHNQNAYISNSRAIDLPSRALQNIHSTACNDLIANHFNILRQCKTALGPLTNHTQEFDGNGTHRMNLHKPIDEQNRRKAPDETHQN